MKQCFQNPKSFSALVNYCGFACFLAKFFCSINTLFLSLVNVFERAHVAYLLYILV